MKMLSINRSLISLTMLHFTDSPINEITKRFFKSWNSLKKVNRCLTPMNCKQSSLPLSQYSLKLRTLSTNRSQKEPKIEAISKKITKMTAKELVESNEEKPKQSAAEAIGIVGIHKWDDLKGVKEWICVYHFPYIVPLLTFQRMKLWLTVINVGTVPLSLVLYSSGSVDLEVVAFYSMVSMFSMFALYIFGHIFSRFVGKIYISDDGKFVRLSHLSFFGKRLDTDFESEDMVPLMCTNNNLNDWYCGIERYSTSQQLYMSLKYGGIVDREAFEKVFGEDSIKFLIQNKKI